MFLIVLLLAAGVAAIALTARPSTPTRIVGGVPSGAPPPPPRDQIKRTLNAVGETWDSPPAPVVTGEPARPAAPTNTATAKRLAPLVAANVRRFRGYYCRPLVAEFQAAAGLRAASTGQPDGIYGGRTRGALLHFGVSDPPAPVSLPDATTPYEYPGGDTSVSQ